MMRKELALAWILVWLVPAVIPGCGPEDSGAVSFHIVYGRTTASAQALGTRLEPLADPPDNIDSFRLCVSAADMDKPKCANFSTADYAKAGKARLDGIPVGTGRVVTFQGYDYKSLDVRWCGEASGIAIENGSTTQVNLFLSVCSGFTATRNNMNLPRVFHTATRLPNGRVLMVGGFSDMSLAAESSSLGSCLRLQATNTVDIYDPATGEFEAQSGITLTYPRGLHTATLLDDGRVLVAGGCKRAVWRLSFPSGPGPILVCDPDPDGLGATGWELAGNTAEIIDPVLRGVEQASMAGLPSRAFHAAQPLPGGSALLIGGLTQGMDAFQTLNTSLRYAPGSEPAFVEVPLTPQEPRHGMTLVPYGDFTTVLLWGGNRAPVTPSDPGIFSEILQWDANGDVHARTPPFVTSQRDKGWPGFYGVAAALPSGQILVTGGMVVDKSFRDDDLPRPQQTFRLLDMTPQSETVLDTADRVMTSPRAMHTATRLERSDIPGEVLLTGGILSVLGTSYSFLDSVEFYSPVDGRFQSRQVGSQVVKLTLARTGHTATPLADGTVLIVGGFTTSPTITQTAEVYNPAPRELRLPSSGGGP